mgnify:CR=1 FL=1
MKRLFLLASIFIFIIGVIEACEQARSTDIKIKVSAIIDNWKTRAEASAAIHDIGQDALDCIGIIAIDEHETHIRRWRSIMLLGTAPSKQSIPFLGQIATTSKAIYRCLALQALAESGSKHAIPILISQLDNCESCMIVTSTDPMQEDAILVSDEAVRALETITGKSFEPNVTFGVHRATGPWKKWWKERSHKP